MNNGTTIFVVGFVAGAWVFWNVSVAVERFRRARLDFRATRQGLRTLMEMMFSRGWEAAKGLATAVVIVGLVAVLWQRYHH